MSVILEAFVFGAASSLHCAAMCGPLALFAGRGGTALAYHASRTGAYSLVGAVLGLGGAGAGIGILRGDATTAAYVLAAALALGAVGADRLLGPVPGLGSVVRSATRRLQRLPPTARAAVLGTVTPLLPCGILYALFGTALLSGGAGPGAATTFGFALGSAPLLLLTQMHSGLLRRRLGPRGFSICTRLAMVVAAGLLAWRGAAADHGAGCCGG